MYAKLPKSLSEYIIRDKGIPIGTNENITADDIRFYEGAATELLTGLMVKTSTKGYAMLKDAIVMTCVNMGLYNSVTGRLYPAIGELHGSTYCGVERNIRYTIKRIFEMNSKKQLNSVLGKCLVSEGHKTNGVFIYRCAEKLRLERNSYKCYNNLMITKEMIDRINYLSRKKKSEGLTEDEQAEQKVLYREYIDAFKANLKAQLDNIEIVDGNGDAGKVQ